MPDVELTELHDIKVVRQDGVKNPASGFTFLVMKALAHPGDTQMAMDDDDADDIGPVGESGTGCGCCPACTCEPPVTKETEGAPVADEPTTTETPEAPEAPEVTKTSGAPEAPDAGTAPEGDSVAKQIEDAVAKVAKDAEERIEALAAELAKMRATPIPGGPMLTATADQTKTRVRSDLMAKATYHDRLASETNGELAKYHREKASEAREAAKA